MYKVALSSMEPMESSGETLLDHYRQHGFPEGKTTLGNMRQLVRGRIAMLTKMDPFFLSDPQKTELRIVENMANRFGIKCNAYLTEPPNTEEERKFLEDIDRRPPPLRMEEFEVYLAGYHLPKKEGLSREIRKQVARIIMIRYILDAKALRKILSSKTIQNYLSDEEYKYIIENMSLEVREKLLYGLIMSDDFKGMDDYCRRYLLESIEVKKEFKNCLYRIIGRVPGNLSRETRATLVRFATLLGDGKLLEILFKEYPSADVINNIFQIADEKIRLGLLDGIYVFLQILSPQEKRKINCWDSILDVAIATYDEEMVRKVFRQAPQDMLSKATYTNLLRASFTGRWSNGFHNEIMDTIVTARKDT